MVKSLFRANKKNVVKSRQPTFLENIRARDVKGNMVLISDFWLEQTVILKVLRRFGCPLCRYESRLLSELKPDFDELGIKLIAVGFEDIGLEDFLSGGYWDWEVLIDSDRATHSILNLKKVSVSVGLKDLLSSATRSAIFASQRAGIQGDMKGDGFQLGGTFIVEKTTGKLLYEHRQITAGSYTSLKEIFEICGGDPEEVPEKAPKECIVYKKVCDI